MLFSHAHIVGIKIGQMLTIVRNVVLQCKQWATTFQTNLRLLLSCRSGMYRSVK